MARKQPEVNGTTWADIAECVPSWERDHGVRVVVEISWRANLSAGAYVDVRLCSAGWPEGSGELVRVRQPFPARKGSGQAGAVMHAIFSAFAELENNPWLWGPDARRKARGDA